MKGYLCLQNGMTFSGETNQNWDYTVEGEVVFFTGMTGYQEVITDPSYKDQIVVFTYPLIGNYGVNQDDFESHYPQVSGVIMLQCAKVFSHYNAVSSFQDYLEKWKIPYLTGIDTREVVKAIRAQGTQNATLAVGTAVKPSGGIKQGQAYKTIGNQLVHYGEGDTHVVLIDFGFKQSILNHLLKMNLVVTVVPFTKLEQVKALNPDGIVLSNGPGDPKEVAPYLPSIQLLTNQFPTFGICLGHQLIALAYGGNTKKLHFGHRGANHPVRDCKTGNVFVTSQNHNYVVDAESLASTDLQPRFINVNDQSIEGLFHLSKPILSVQFHPEASPGPEDAEWNFKEFLSMINESRRKKNA